MNSFYVTTPIYYPNDVPHLGHAYTTIAADVLARWHRQRGDQVYFLTGTDEHGKKIEAAARENGLDPQEFVDGLVPQFKEEWDLLRIKADRFIRTTDADHEQVVKSFVRRVHENGDLYKGHYTGSYCVGCESFVKDKDLVDGLCPLHKTRPEEMAEETYFFRLSRYRDALLRHFDAHPDFIRPEARLNEIVGKLQEGLEDFSVTRTTFRWGIPFPLDADHIVYVWFDALINYLTGIGFLTDNSRFKQFWPECVHLVGKDILWHHTVYWPAMLLSAGLPLPKSVFAHGWWTIEGEKMSKTLGNFIRPREILSLYDADAFRAYLFWKTVFGRDGDFSRADCVSFVNEELANRLGNLVLRVVRLVRNHFGGSLADPGTRTAIDESFLETWNCLEHGLAGFMEAQDISHYLSRVFEFVRAMNQYLDAAKPWVVLREPSGRERTQAILGVALAGLARTGYLLLPFMPSKMALLLESLGVGSPEKAFVPETGTTPSTWHVADPPPLFPRIEATVAK
jgi:methionyl-tRNA synthetase